MICSKCGAEIKGTSRFCSQCGEPVSLKVNDKEVGETPKRLSKFSKPILRVAFLVGLIGLVCALAFGVGLFFVEKSDSGMGALPAVLGPSTDEIKASTVSSIKKIVATRSNLKDFVTVSGVRLVHFEQNGPKEYLGDALVSMWKKGAESKPATDILYHVRTTLEGDAVYVEIQIDQGELPKVKKVVGFLNWLKLNF